MFKKIIFMVLALVVLTSTATVAMAASDMHTGDPQISLPGGIEIEQKDDLSASVFRRLLGTVWVAVAGNGGSDPTFDRFSRLLPTIMGAANLAAMTILSCLILYYWVVMAVTTAQEGKGTKITSFWVPLRQVTSYGLTAPVAAGLSVLQVATIAVVAIGINLANVTWREASNYIVANVDTRVESVAPVVETEARDAIQPIFQAVVVQELLKVKSWEVETEGTERRWVQGTFYYPNPRIKDQKASESFDEYGGVTYTSDITVKADYIIEHKKREGRLILWFMPGTTMEVGSLGGISIPAPVYNEDDLKNPKKKAEYDALFQISKERLLAMFKMAESLREHARWFLSITELQIRPTGSVERPQSTGHEIIAKYKQDVASGSASAIKTLAEANASNSKLAQALGIQGGTPQGGWITAGVLPFLLATATSQFDAMAYGGGLQFVLMQNPMPDGSKDGSEPKGFLEIIGYHTPIPWGLFDLKALRMSPTYATQEILAGRSYTGHTQSGDTQGIISRGITTAFFGGSMNNSGILSTTMTAFTRENPISALVWFGDRLLTIGLQAVGLSAVAGGIGMVPGMSWVNEIVNNPISLFFMGCLLVVGGIFTYVIPIYFLMVFFQALWPWIVSVVQTLIASPLWAVAHALPEGDGFAGQHARRGYVQLIDVAIRPFLLVVAVCASYIVIQSAAYIIHELFSLWANGVTNYSTISAPSQLVWSIIYASLVFLSVKTLTVDFLLKMPGAVIGWIGGVGMSMGSAESAAHESTTVIGGALGASTRTIGGIGSHLGQHKLGDKGKDGGKEGGKDGGKGDGKDGGKGKGVADDMKQITPNIEQ